MPTSCVIYTGSRTVCLIISFLGLRWCLLTPPLLVKLVAGIMLKNEAEVLENMKTSSNQYFVPIVWAASLVNRARKEGRVKDDFAVKTLIDVRNLSVLFCTSMLWSFRRDFVEYRDCDAYV